MQPIAIGFRKQRQHQDLREDPKVRKVRKI
jgi:hypothetical protein